MKRINKITIKDAHELACILFDDDGKHLPKADKVKPDEIWVDTIKRKKDKVIFEINCRCFDGYVELFPNGDIFLYNNDEELQAIENQMRIIGWIFSKYKLTF